jgi:enoyl-CoA hydratase/carnithine racemase
MNKNLSAAGQVISKFETLVFQRYGHVALITLNRPEAMNAFTGLMGEEWSEAYEYCNEDDEIRAVVVTGEGRAFCAGADMSGGGETFDTQDDMDFSTCPVMPAWQVKKPVIAALNGHAIGLGFSLALQCDFRIAAAEGKYGLLQVRRGVLSDACTHWLLPRLVGVQTAMEVLLLGRKMSGNELVEKGLAMQCVAAEDVLTTAMHLAQELASECAPLICSMAKSLVWQSMDMNIEQMEQKETAWLHHSMGKADAVEGGTAFFERREPQWKGSVSKEWPEDDG